MKQVTWFAIGGVLLLACLFVMSQPLYGVSTGFMMIFANFRTAIPAQIAIQVMSVVTLIAVAGTAIAGIRKRD
jgi:hypothetical protein